MAKIDKKFLLSCYAFTEFSLLLGDLLVFFMTSHSLCSLKYYLQFPFSGMCHLKNTSQIFHQLHQGSHKYVKGGVFMYRIMLEKDFGL